MAGHPRFFELLELMKKTHIFKNKRYAKKTNPLSNLKMCEELGIPAYIGTFIRMGDKFSRLTELIGDKDLDPGEETILDNLLDLANYSLLCYILYEEKLAENIEKETVTPKIEVDDTIPPDEILVVAHDGKWAGKITGIGPKCMCTDICSPHCIYPIDAQKTP